MISLPSLAYDSVEQLFMLEIGSMSKSYPGVQALRNVDLDLGIGEVHALVGENGAGKSTLIKMITGAEQPDHGTIKIEGRLSEECDARMRRSQGISAIYQELTIVPEMSVSSNVFLHDPPKKHFIVDRSSMKASFDKLASKFNLSIHPDDKAGSLSIADRQMIEIIRAINTKCKILIMDEPTSTLGPAEREKLYEVISELKGSGVSIIFISHDLDEVLQVSDRISVMRNGKLIGTKISKNWTKDSLVASMIGSEKPGSQSKRKASYDEDVLVVENLMPLGNECNINFTLRKGEILGIAGLVGSGRTEILNAIAGNDPNASGTITISGNVLDLPINVRGAIRNGIVLVPEDRKAQGLIPLMTGAENVVLTDLSRVGNLGVSDRNLQTNLAVKTTGPLGFASGELSQIVMNLSGGNQQKLVIGKWLHRRPAVLLLDEPTRGVDIGAKAEIYSSIRALADQGLSVVLVSSELPEIVEQSDRVIILTRGKIAALLEGKEISVERILSTIFAIEDSS